MLVYVQTQKPVTAQHSDFWRAHRKVILIIIAQQQAFKYFIDDNDTRRAVERQWFVRKINQLICALRLHGYLGVKQFHRGIQFRILNVEDKIRPWMLERIFLGCNKCQQSACYVFLGKRKKKLTISFETIKVVTFVWES